MPNYLISSSVHQFEIAFILISRFLYLLVSEITDNSYVCAGYVGEVCEVQVDSIPTILDLFGGEICVVNNNEQCDEVYINAERFAINPKFSCRVVVSIERVLIGTRTRSERSSHVLFVLAAVFFY